MFPLLGLCVCVCVCFVGILFGWLLGGFVVSHGCRAALLLEVVKGQEHLHFPAFPI